MGKWVQYNPRLLNDLPMVLTHLNFDDTLEDSSTCCKWQQLELQLSQKVLFESLIVLTIWLLQKPKQHFTVHYNHCNHVPERSNSLFTCFFSPLTCHMIISTYIIIYVPPCIIILIINKIVSCMHAYVYIMSLCLWCVCVFTASEERSRLIMTCKGIPSTIAHHVNRFFCAGGKLCKLVGNLRDRKSVV